MEKELFLNKKAILKRLGILARESVEVPEWGGKVWVQEMTAEQRDAFDDWILRSGEESDKSSLRARVVSLCAVDEDGKRLFSDLDIPDLKRMSSKAIGRVARKAFDLSGFSEGVVADMEKNSEAVLSDDSTSDSAES
jgi:hypothetical protein